MKTDTEIKTTVIQTLYRNFSADLQKLREKLKVITDKK
jgi:hypothetical protein